MTTQDHLHTEAATRSWSEFIWYLSGHGSYFGALGIQAVIYPYLVTFYLNKPADMVGIAQMFQMLPMFSLILIGGATADRNELRMHLVRLLFMAATPVLLLIGFIITGHLTFFWLVFCTTAVGCVGAFVMPARDALLSRVSERSPNGNLQQAVMIITGSQFGFQLLGMVVALTALYELADSHQASVTLLISVLLILISAFCCTFVHPAPPERDYQSDLDAPKNGVQSFYKPILEGLMEVRRSDRMWPVIVIMFAIGMLFMGVLLVYLQIMIRDAYMGTIQDFSLISMTFMGGIAVASLILSRIGSLESQGRALMMSFIVGFGAMVSMYFEPSYWMLYPLALMWGAATGVTISVSRAIVQDAAPEGHGARIMSIYNLGFLGGAPAGSLMIGYAIKFLGVHNAVLVPAGLVALVWLVMLFTTDIWNIRHSDRTV